MEWKTEQELLSMGEETIYHGCDPTHWRYAERMDLAQARNRQRDHNEQEAGRFAVGASPLPVQLRTVISLLACGITLEDWNRVAEALDRLQTAELELRRGARGDPSRKGIVSETQ